MRGNRAHERFCAILLGTPPRMRGKLTDAQNADKVIGNTPTYAGKTLHHQHVSEPKPDFSITSSDKPTLQPHAGRVKSSAGTP